MEKELLQKAIDSILHGSTQVVPVQDYNNAGAIRYETVRIGDLRLMLIDKLAERMVNSIEFKEAITKAFTPDAVLKMLNKVTGDIKYQDLPYSVRNKIEKEMNDAKLEVRKYTVVAEVIKS